MAISFQSLRGVIHSQDVIPLPCGAEIQRDKSLRMNMKHEFCHCWARLARHVQAADSDSAFLFRWKPGPECVQMQSRLQFTISCRPRPNT